GFIPEVCNAPTLFPQDSLDAAEIDHLAKTLIAAFHSVMLMEVLPTEAINKIYLTISQIALPEIMQDELLSAYQIFMFDCASSNHGRSFCLGTQPNCFPNFKPLRCMTHPKVLTTQKVPKKKKKKQKDEWNKSLEVSDDEDWSLQQKWMFDDLKRLQTAVTSAMKGRLMHGLIKLLNFLVLPMYKLAIHNPLQFECNWALPLIPHEVNDVWIECVTANQPLCDRTNQGTHYRYLPNTIISLLQVDGDWFQRLMTCMPLAAPLASSCSAAEYTYVNDLLVRQAQNFDPVTHTAFYESSVHTLTAKKLLDHHTSVQDVEPADEELLELFELNFSI
uniref:Uncharacterized protein n=1 Tax=Romanomermis culicivorax TaxID=13658 RepID=A0A915L8Z8_ROMCU